MQLLQNATLAVLSFEVLYDRDSLVKLINELVEEEAAEEHADHYNQILDDLDASEGETYSITVAFDPEVVGLPELMAEISEGYEDMLANIPDVCLDYCTGIRFLSADTDTPTVFVHSTCLPDDLRVSGAQESELH